MSANNFKLGIDVGGTGIKAGLIRDGRIVDKATVPTGAERPYSYIIEDMYSLVRELLHRNGVPIEALRGVGVGMPGSIKPDGTVVYSPNIRWKDVPLGAELSRLLNLPVRVENDANVAGLGEHLYGGESFDSSVLITLGTGVGAGIVLDGKIFSGYMGAGAEIGHTVICSGGELCGCGRRGCFEAYSSATALIRDTKRAMEADSSSLMWKGFDLATVSGLTAFEAAKQGDRSAQAVVDSYIDMLSEGIVNVINAFRPQAVFLGGGVSGQGEFLLKPLRRLCIERAYGSFEFAPFKILAAKLGNDAGILGAASLFD